MTFWQALCIAICILVLIVLFCYVFVWLVRFLENIFGEIPALIIVGLGSLSIVMWIYFC